MDKQRIEEIQEWLMELKKFSINLTCIPSKKEHAEKNIRFINDIEVIIKEYSNGTI